MIANLPNQQPQNTLPQQPIQQQNPLTSLNQIQMTGSNSSQPQPQPQPQQPAPQAAAPPQNVEQNALAGNNKQQISNFMSALNNVGAGGNNSFMNTATTAAPQAQNLINPNTAYANNGGAQGMQPAGGTQIPMSANNGAYANNGGGGGSAPPSQPAVGGTQIPMQGDGGMTYTPPIPSGTSQPAVGGTQVPMSPTLGGGGGSAPPAVPNVPLQPQQQMLVSDENLKTDISPAQSKLNDFMSKIGAHNYTYKDKQDGVGTFTSPMAQELEATELGKQAVIDTPRGKMVDYARLGGVNLAAVSVVHKEQEKLKAQVLQLKRQFKLVSKGK